MKLKVRKKVKLPKKKFKLKRKIKETKASKTEETPPDLKKETPPELDFNKSIVLTEFPTLYAKSSQGKMMVWQIKVAGIKTTLTYGYLNGTPIHNESVVLAGKNIGKSNETTPAEQAALEAQSTFNKKIDEGYVDSEKEAETKVILLPMLALKYAERNHDIIFPAFVQPKLNGVRCLCKRTGKTLTYISKKGKSFHTLGHLDDEILLKTVDGEIIDGEIYTTDFSFQKIVSALKKIGPNTPKLEFHCYDIVSDEDFEKRTKRVAELDGTMLKSVPTYEVHNAEEIVKFYKDFVLAGNEGLMVRNKRGGYTLNYRTSDLQKFKTFEDKEFKIVGATEGAGLDKGCIIFLCENEDGNTFKCRPKGTKTKRREQYRNKETFNGKLLTTRFAARSDDNIPVHPVGLAVRDYE